MAFKLLNELDVIFISYDEDNCEVQGWGDKLCGDEDIWQKLEEYILANKAELEAILDEVLYFPS